jgi:hypothetical protein
VIRDLRTDFLCGRCGRTSERWVQIKYGNPYRVEPYSLGDQVEPDPEAPEEYVRLVVVRGSMVPCPSCGPKWGDPEYHNTWEQVDVFVEEGVITGVRQHDPRQDFQGDRYDYVVLDP